MYIYIYIYILLVSKAMKTTRGIRVSRWCWPRCVASEVGA